MLCPSWGYKGQSRWHEKKSLVVVWIGQTTIGNNDSFHPSIHEDVDLHEVESNFVCSLYFSVYYIMKKMVDDWSERMFPHMGGAGEKEMRATSEWTWRRETEEITRMRARDTAIIFTTVPVDLHYFNLYLS